MSENEEKLKKPRRKRRRAPKIPIATLSRTKYEATTFSLIVPRSTNAS
jgi:hypothetical protein